jgi:hypothetical protein
MLILRAEIMKIFNQNNQPWDLLNIIKLDVLHSDLTYLVPQFR